VRDDFPALWQFLGAYLHQDWRDEYSSPDMAFQDFLTGEPTLAPLMAAELNAVLSSGRDEEDLERLVREGGSFYLPRNDGIATSAWLASLLAALADSDL
jgi:hypothetical protein